MWAAGENEAQRAFVKYAAVVAVARSHNGSALVAPNMPDGNIPHAVNNAHISQNIALITARSALHIDQNANAVVATVGLVAGDVDYNDNAGHGNTLGKSGAINSIVYITSLANAYNNNIAQVAAPAHGNMQAILLPVSPLTSITNASLPILNNAIHSITIVGVNGDNATASKKRANLLSMSLTQTDIASAHSATAQQVANINGNANITTAANDKNSTNNDLKLYARGGALMINIARAVNIIGIVPYTTGAAATSTYTYFNVVNPPNAGAAAAASAAPANVADVNDIYRLVNALCYYINCGAGAVPNINTPSGLKKLWNELFGQLAPIPVAYASGAAAGASPAIQAFNFPNFANIKGLTNAIATQPGGVHARADADLADRIINYIVDEIIDLPAQHNNEYFHLGGSPQQSQQPSKFYKSILRVSKPLRVKRFKSHTRKHKVQLSKHRGGGKQLSQRKNNGKTIKNYKQKGTLTRY